MRRRRKQTLDPKTKLSDLDNFPGKTPPNPNKQQADGDAAAENNRKAEESEIKIDTDSLRSAASKKEYTTNVCVWAKQKVLLHINQMSQ